MRCFADEDAVSKILQGRRLSRKAACRQATETETKRYGFAPREAYGSGGVSGITGTSVLAS